MTLDGQHVLIVGGTRGIGRATVAAARAADARVTATGRSAASLARLPDGVAGRMLDYTDPAAVAALAETLDGVDHLVLSASDAVAWGPFADLGEPALRAALEAMARVLAVELAPRRVNTVSPGLTATEAYAGLPDAARAAMFAATAARLPAGRVGAPDDIAQAILLAIANPFLTGATLDVDGGAHLAR